VLEAYSRGRAYADPDAIDLTSYYERTIEEISTSQIGRDVVLPLLGGGLPITFDDRDCIDGERIARAESFNSKQAEAVGLAFGAEQVACIQGPPGTGKTRVLALIARLMVERGERLLMTSHTHMAINNALNKIHAQGVPTVKVGRGTQRKGLDDGVECCPSLGAWESRPRSTSTRSTGPGDSRRQCGVPPATGPCGNKVGKSRLVTQAETDSCRTSSR